MNKKQQDFIKIGFVYAVILLVFAGIVSDEWRSDGLFNTLGIYPYGLGIIFWPLLGYLFPRIESLFDKYLLVSAIALYDFSAVYKFMSSDAEEMAFFERVWRMNKLGILVLAAFYLGGQLFMVRVILARPGFGCRLHDKCSLTASCFCDRKET
ncbi:MAG TPA: hypothetical protein VGC66_02570 [Pyrinomonadaceae bacterium]|jgi:hypothetical protein